MKKRIIMSVFGVMLCAVSMAFFKYAAFGMDAFQVFVNGMTEGVGTIITAFCMGPLIEVFNKNIAEPLLYGKR